MYIRTPRDFGLVIRDRRRNLKLSQTDLARKVGVGRQWIVGVERGKPRAELGLVLRTFTALGLSLTLDSGARFPGFRDDDGIAPVDIDDILDDAMRRLKGAERGWRK